VVIIDIRMPGGGGLPVLKDLKARTPGRVAIILTSFPFPQYREAYLAAGADYFFDKTKDIPQMTDKLIELASKNRGSLDSDLEGTISPEDNGSQRNYIFGKS
jgi:DNA-binding NarL/FixJ family response regulator